MPDITIHNGVRCFSYPCARRPVVPEACLLHHERRSLTSFGRHASGHGQVTYRYAHWYHRPPVGSVDRHALSLFEEPLMSLLTYLAGIVKALAFLRFPQKI
jgi:hypothetical protein